MRKLWLILPLVLLSACNGPRDRQLEARIAQLSAEREQLARIAEHLDEYRQQALMQSDLEKTGDVEPVTDPAPLLKKMEAHAGGASVGYQQPARLTLSGKGGRLAAVSSLAGVSTVEPGLVVTQVDIGTSDWKVALSMRGTPPAARTTVDDDAPLPPPGLFCFADCARQRGRAQVLQREVKELKRMTGEIAEIQARKSLLLWHLNVIDNEPDRLHQVGPQLALLFGGEKPVFAAGSATAAPGHPLEAQGTLAPGVNAANLSDYLKGSFELLSVEAGSARLRARRQP